MLQKITVPIMRYSDETDDRILDYVQAWAWVVGNFAIHKWIEVGPPTVFGGWSVTHTPSGCRLNKHPMTRDKVRERLDWALNFEWRGQRVLDDMPVCELLEVAPLIYDDFGKPEEGQEWAKEHRPFIARANRCL